MHLVVIRSCRNSLFNWVESLPPMKKENWGRRGRKMVAIPNRRQIATSMTTFSQRAAKARLIGSPLFVRYSQKTMMKGAPHPKEDYVRGIRPWGELLQKRDYSSAELKKRTTQRATGLLVALDYVGVMWPGGANWGPSRRWWRESRRAAARRRLGVRPFWEVWWIGGLPRNLVKIKNYLYIKTTTVLL